MLRLFFAALFCASASLAQFGLDSGLGQTVLYPAQAGLVQWLNGTAGSNAAARVGDDAPYTGINCLAFSGTAGEGITITAPSANSAAFGACTISGWFRINNFGSNQVLWSHGTSAYRCYINTARQIILNTITDTGAYWPNDTGWHYIEVDYDESGNSSAVRIDGVSAGSNFGSDTQTPGTYDLTVGNRDGVRVLNGSVSGFAVSGFTRLPIEYGAGTTAWDVTGNGNHGTISGGTWTNTAGIPSHNLLYGWGTSTNGISPALTLPTVGGLEFDGLTDSLTVTGLTSSDIVTVQSFEEDAVLGDELVTNGDFSDGDTGWTGYELSINYDYYISPPTSLKITSTSSYSWSGSYIYQSLSETTSNCVLLSAYIYADSGDLASFAIYNETDGTFELSRAERAFELSAGWSNIQQVVCGLDSAKSYRVYVAFYDPAKTYLVDDLSAKELLSDSAVPTAGTDTISWTKGQAYGWVYINGEAVYNLSELTGKETDTLTSCSTNWPDASIVTTGLEDMHIRVADASGIIVDAENQLPVTASGGFVHNGAECSLVINGVTNSYADLLTYTNSYGSTQVSYDADSGRIRHLLRYDAPKTNAINQIYLDVFK